MGPLTVVPNAHFVFCYCLSNMSDVLYCINRLKGLSCNSNVIPLEGGVVTVLNHIFVGLNCYEIMKSI